MSLIHKQPNDLCPTCGRKLAKNGRDKKGAQMYCCVWCVRPHGEGRHIRPIPNETMTDRRIQVLKLAGEGLTYKEIAQKIFIAPRTVKNTLCDVHRILDARNTPHAVYIACKRGMI